MTEEVGRRLIDGVWVTNVEAQGGSGGGGITRVTSDDETVTITNPTGPVVDLSAGGGSQPVKSATVTLTSADILALDATPFVVVEGVADTVLIPITAMSTCDGEGKTLYTVTGGNFIETDQYGIFQISFSKFDLLLATGNDTGGSIGIEPLGAAFPGGTAALVDTAGHSIRIVNLGGANTDGDFDVTVTVLYQEVAVP